MPSIPLLCFTTRKINIIQSSESFQSKVINTGPGGETEAELSLTPQNIRRGWTVARLQFAALRHLKSLYEWSRKCGGGFVHYSKKSENENVLYCKNSKIIWLKIKIKNKKKHKTCRIFSFQNNVITYFLGQEVSLCLKVLGYWGSVMWRLWWGGGGGRGLSCVVTSEFRLSSRCVTR